MASPEIPNIFNLNECLKDVYFEVWIDEFRKEEIENELRKVCSEIHEVLYDYQFIVEVEDEKLLQMDGVRRYRKHYDC